MSRPAWAQFTEAETVVEATVDPRPVRDGLETSCRVRCQGKLHTLELRRGRPVLLDHTTEEIESERALASLLGETTCRCLAITDGYLQAVGHHDERVSDATRLARERYLASQLPKALEKAAQAAVKRREYRAVERRPAKPWPPLRERVGQYARARALEAADYAGYRRPQSRMVTTTFSTFSCDIQIVPDQSCSIRGAGVRTRHKKHWWSEKSVQVSLHLDPARYLRVLRAMPAHGARPAGLANDNGCDILVVELTEEKDGGLVAWAGKQGQGYSIYQRPCVLHRSKKEEGMWEVSKWL